MTRDSIPEGRKVHKGISELADEISAELGFPVELERAKEPLPIASDWGQRAGEKGIMSTYLARHPEMRAIFVKAALRDQIAEIQKLFAEVQERDKEIRKDMAELGINTGEKELTGKEVAKGLSDGSLTSACPWGCALRGRPHFHTVKKTGGK